MTGITAYLTEAGLAELLDNAQGQLGPVKITEIAIGDSGWTPAPDTNGLVDITALVNEVTRLSAISGSVVDNNRLHITARDDSTDTYDAAEIGIFSESGTLLAVAASTTDFFSKAAGKLLLSFDLLVTGNAASSITIDEIGFGNPPASETDYGVIQLGTQAQVNEIAGGVLAVTPETLAGNLAVRLPQAAQYGLVLSHTSGTVTGISAGRILDTSRSTLLTLASSITKRIDQTFDPGSGQGGLSGSLTVAANATYHFFVVRTAGGDIDVGIDTSASAANLVTDHGILAAGYIGARRTDGSGALIPVICRGPLTARKFVYASKAVESALGGSVTSSAATKTSARLPAGVTVLAHLLYALSARTGGANHLLVSSLSESDQSPTEGLAQITTQQGLGVGASAVIDVYAESSQFRVRAAASGSTAAVSVLGYTQHLA